jgi:hypothetical protein
VCLGECRDLRRGRAVRHFDRRGHDDQGRRLLRDAGADLRDSFELLGDVGGAQHVRTELAAFDAGAEMLSQGDDEARQRFDACGRVVADPLRRIAEHHHRRHLLVVGQGMDERVEGG